ncbi:hypothetical protein BOTBODRAFT_190281 [Botryobasidium botryosum FD-172 SS1]|uniref:Uncharacterized protein n=1 Tax=Botryobasidium botryosum (strain FD-172 SS1) TaxID=930990 RepID=A0A067M5M8_BOTB1|nr:hypothetical protein BOTBODRAFT_190281 [Botryobasidium botryosum FD-172 SS1]
MPADGLSNWSGPQYSELRIGMDYGWASGPWRVSNHVTVTNLPSCRLLHPYSCTRSMAPRRLKRPKPVVTSINPYKRTMTMKVSVITTTPSGKMRVKHSTRRILVNALRGASEEPSAEPPASNSAPLQPPKRAEAGSRANAAPSTSTPRSSSHLISTNAALCPSASSRARLDSPKPSTSNSTTPPPRRPTKNRTRKDDGTAKG